MAKRSKKWQRQRRKGDRIVEDGSEKDIVVAVMGATGVGKSTFVNALFGADIVEVGHDLKSCTAQLQHVVVNIPDKYRTLRMDKRRLVVVDTPGFNDTYVEDSEILRRIAVWLASSYHAEMKLGGAIYLYDISQKRLTNSASLNLEMFEKLCGNEAYKSIVIGTTKWTQPTEETCNAREKELTNTLWKEVCEGGAKVVQIWQDKESKWNVMDAILCRIEADNAISNPLSSERLRIQKEMVEEEMRVPVTAAGRYLRYTLEEILASKQRLVRSVADEKERKELEEGIENYRRQIQSLNIPIARRILDFLGL